MKRSYYGISASVAVVLVFWFVLRSISHYQEEELLHSERGETNVLISAPSGVTLRLFKAGTSLQNSDEVEISGNEKWLPPGNYFLESRINGRILAYPLSLRGFQSGPDAGGSFVLTVRNPAENTPPEQIGGLSASEFIPSGSFLFGDRFNPLEPHHVWLTGYFMEKFEVTNLEFKQFVDASDGYVDDSNWTKAGQRWKLENRSKATALLTPRDENFERFGQPDQPVTWVNWFEANAYCVWLTKKFGGGRWLFSLPSEAEWEKAARGPDSFDYGLSMTIGDSTSRLYNWKKNPDAPVTVVGYNETRRTFASNRYGLYHMSGNVTEWTQSLNWQNSQRQPYRDDERNHNDTEGLRVARGGSWYSASVAYLYLPYRDAFQPEHSTQETGFRIVARALP